MTLVKSSATIIKKEVIMQISALNIQKTNLSLGKFCTSG